MRWLGTWGWAKKYVFLWKQMYFWCIGLHFGYRVTIHQWNWSYAKSTCCPDETLCFWALKLSKVLNLNPKLIKFGESEGNLELSWDLNRNPLGPGDTSLVHSGPQMHPTGANKGQGGPVCGLHELGRSLLWLVAVEKKQKTIKRKQKHKKYNKKKNN